MIVISLILSLLAVLLSSASIYLILIYGKNEILQKKITSEIDELHR